MAAIGVSDYLDKKFIELPFEGDWQNSFGNPEKNFRMLIWGEPKNGKTEFCIKLAKYLAQFTKVYYNSYEQKISKSLQDAIKRNKMHEVAGKIIFGVGESFEEMKVRLSKKNSPGACFIDSLDYMELTEEQYKELVELFPRKIFVIICWSKGAKPRKPAAEAIRYMVDVTARVRNFKAEVASRYGGSDEYDVWPERNQKQDQKPEQTPKVAQIDLFKASKSA